MKKKVVVQVEVPDKEVVNIEESEYTKSDNESNSDFESIFSSDSKDEINDYIEISMVAKRSKAKGVATISPKNRRTKGFFY